MATHDYVIDNSTGANVRADINNVLQAILTNNSSSSAPSTTAAYMWWADTTNGVLKIRNSANNGWVELLQLDGTLTLEDGTNSAPALAFRDDLDTGIYSSAANTFNVATGGVERMELGTTTIFNEQGEDVDFRIEGDTNNYLFYLDASTDRIGIGTNSPQHDLDILKTTSGADTSFRVGSTNVSGDNDATIIINNGGSGDASLRFDYESSESRCKIYVNSSTNDLIFDTDGDETMRLTSDHKMLIGTSTKNTSDALTVLDSGSVFMSIRSDQGTDGNSQVLDFAVGTGNRASGNLTGVIEADIHSSSGGSLKSDLVFMTNAGDSISERLRIKDDGKVGIGDSTPSVTLETSGHNQVTFGSMPETIISYGMTSAYNSGSAGGGIQFGGKYHSNNDFTIFGGVHGVKENTTDGNFGGALLFSTRQHGGNSSEHMRINSTGLVGINNNDPAFVLDITGPGTSNGSTLNLTDAASSADSRHIKLTRSSTEAYIGIAGSVPNDPFFLSRSGNADFAIGSTGNCGIGQTQPDKPLVVKKSGNIVVAGIEAQTASAVNLDLSNSISSGRANFFRFLYNSSEVGSVYSDGSTTVFNTGSDYRLKENVVAISDGITRLKALKPSRFNFKRDSSRTIDGFLAHEVSSIVPEAISGTKDEVATEDNEAMGVKEGDPIYQGIDQSKLVPLLTAALQESISKIEVLETKVAALEAA